MKIAIPLFGNWISPRFGFSPEMWILEAEGGEVISQEKISMAGLVLSQWFSRLSSLGVETVICGGIDGFCRRQLENLGICVVHEIAGEAGDALKLFLDDKLQPGFRICRRRGRGFKEGKGRFFEPPWAMYDKKK